MSEIFTKIPLVMSEIGAIGKTRSNPQQGYKFRGIDEVYNAVNTALSKYGIFCAPTVLNMSREERQTKTGGTLLYTILNIKYTFYASDGSFFECVTVGEAMDSGDKSCNKAMSAAQKYAFFQVFSIPTEEPKDTEHETHEVISKKPTEGGHVPRQATGSPKPREAGSTPAPSANLPVDGSAKGRPEPIGGPTTSSLPPISGSDSGLEPGLQGKTSPKSHDNLITEGQKKLIFAKCQTQGINIEHLKTLFGVKHIPELKKDQMNAVLEYIDNPV